MLTRALLLMLGVWLIAASGLSAHAGPCRMENAPARAVIAGAGHEHCELMAMTQTPAPDLPDHTDPDWTCCCPAVLAALPAAAAPDAAQLIFARPSDFPPDTRAPTRTLLPEPRPPKA
ncbi:MAG: hypothetical protein ACO33A_10470 [Hyphomonas sp.]